VVIFLPLPSECWDYRPVAPSLANAGFLTECSFNFHGFLFVSLFVCLFVLNKSGHQFKSHLEKNAFSSPAHFTCFLFFIGRGSLCINQEVCGHFLVCHLAWFVAGICFLNHIVCMYVCMYVCECMYEYVYECIATAGKWRCWPSTCECQDWTLLVSWWQVPLPTESSLWHWWYATYAKFLNMKVLFVNI